MAMTFPAGNRHIVELTQTPLAGTPWVVRVYKKRFMIKRRISSDWFLDGEQARRFADQLSRELGNPDTPTLIRKRKPGWVLRRPVH
jgi:hypothetical protein